MIKPGDNIITEHFDIFNNTVIIDMPVGNEWWLLTYNNHKLVEKLTWKLY